MRKLAFLFVLLSLTAACGDDFNILAQTLSGTHGGQNWRFQGGRTSMWFDGQVLLELYDSPIPDCASGTPSIGRSIIVAAKPEVGSTDFDLQHTATFVTDSGQGAPDNKATTTGKLQIDEVTTTMLNGGLATRFNADNDVNGLFELVRCDQ